MFIGNLAPVVNTDDWIDAMQLVDEETGDAIDIADATEIIVNIREIESQDILLSVALSAGTVAHIETGVFQWTFTAAQMGALDGEHTYEAVARITKDGIVSTIMIGNLPVLQG